LIVVNCQHLQNPCNRPPKKEMEHSCEKLQRKKKETAKTLLPAGTFKKPNLLE